MVTLVLILLLQVAMLAEQQAANNRGDFTALCSVYNLAAAVAKMDPSGNVEGNDEAESLLDEITFLNISAADQEYYDFGPQSTGANPEERAKATEDWRNYKRTLQEKVKVKLGEKNTKVHPTRPGQLTSRKIEHILQQAQRHFAKFKESLNNTSTALNEAKKLAEKAIFGEGGARWDGTIEEATFSGAGSGTSLTSIKRAGQNWGTTTNGKGCGHTTGEKAGLNIISDLTCLCIGRGNLQATPTGGACAEGLPGFNDDFTQVAATALLATATGWGKLKPFCDKVLKVDTVPTAARLTTALENFLTRIGRAMPNAVGGGAGGTCGEVSAAKDVCVNYKDMIGHNADAQRNGGFRGIPWVNEIYDAAGKIEAAETTKREAEKEVEKIRALSMTALLVYHDGMHTSQFEAADSQSIKKNTTQQGSSTSTERATAQESTAVSPAALPSFILPWTLLI